MRNPLYIATPDGDFQSKSIATEQVIKCALSFGPESSYQIQDWLKDCLHVPLFLVALWLGLSSEWLLHEAPEELCTGPFLTLGISEFFGHPWLPIYCHNGGLEL